MNETTMTVTGMAKLKLSEVKELVCADSLSRKAGVFTARLGFFYRNGGTAESFAAQVLAAVPGAVLVDKGEVWKAFNGAASVANQSHWWVKFTVAA